MELSMDETEQLGKRLDNVNELLKQNLSDWARTYWMTVHQQLVRKLHVKNIKDTKSAC
jgi:Trp operon repressor